MHTVKFQVPCICGSREVIVRTAGGVIEVLCCYCDLPVMASVEIPVQPSWRLAEM